MTALALSAVTVGDSITPLSRRVEQEQISAYADASGDRNPIHLDPEFAVSVGLPGAIAHGMLELGILAEAISVWAGGRLIRRLAVSSPKRQISFPGPVPPAGALP